MTTPSTPRKAGPLLGNDSQTSWPFGFKVFAESDISVTISSATGVESELTLDSDYSVSLNANQETSPGGVVTYPISGTPLETGGRLVIVGALDYDQTLNLPTGGNYSAKSLENQLDRLTMQIQQLREASARGLLFPVTDEASAVSELPPAIDRIGRLLSGDSTGKIVAVAPVVDSSTDVRIDLATPSGAALVGFKQAGTGAVDRTVDDQLKFFVNVKQFGNTGNASTGDDAVLQLAINYLHKISDDSGAQGVLAWEGTIYLAAPVNFGKNIVLRGKGRNFKSVIKPLATFAGGYLLGFDGDLCIGGWAFRLTHEAFTIDCSNIANKAQLPMVYKVNKCYDYQIDVWIYNAVGTGIDIYDSNWGTLVKPSIYGRTASASVSEYGIRCRGSTVAAEGGVKIISPDVELFNRGISQEGNSRVDVNGSYLERNIIGWSATGNTDGYLTVVGGQSKSPGASGTAAVIDGDNVTVLGGRYDANGGSGLVVTSTSRHQNVELLNVSGDVSDARNYARKNRESTRWYRSSARSQKDVADNVATTFFNVIVPNLSTHFGTVEVTVNARDTSGYSMWTAKYRFAVSNPDGTLRVTPVVEHAKTNVNISGNYSLAVTCATSVASTTCSFQITADAGGSLGNGTSPRVSAEAELLQWDVAGGVYLQAV